VEDLAACRRHRRCIPARSREFATLAIPRAQALMNNARVISHRRKFIFIHVPKAAGTSVIDALVEHEDAASTGPARFGSIDASFNPPPPHLAARHYLEYGLVSRQQFEEYFKFAFVRNPWDRIVSEYRYRRYPQRYSFKDYLFRHFPAAGWADEYCHVIPQYDFLFDGDGRQLVNFIGRYEQIATDFDEVRRILGAARATLPHRNRSNSLVRRDNDLLEVCRTVRGFLSLRQRRNSFAHYTAYYDDESIEFVRNLYRQDIEAFGYRFGQ
jgi:hypothetical protein